MLYLKEELNNMQIQVPNFEIKIGLKGKQVKVLHGPATVMVSSLHYATARHSAEHEFNNYISYKNMLR